MKPFNFILRVVLPRWKTINRRERDFPDNKTILDGQLRGGRPVGR